MYSEGFILRPKGIHVKLPVWFFASIKMQMISKIFKTDLGTIIKICLPKMAISTFEAPFGQKVFKSDGCWLMAVV